jgi:hypothetical protein
MTRHSLFLLTTLFIAGIASAANPTQIPGLQLWLTDASNNYNPTTGVWTDISGNGNDAVPLGTVANTGITYTGPALNGVASTIDTNTSAVVFNGGADDLLVAAGLNGGAGIGELTIITVYSAPNVAINGAVRPAGFGALAAETPAAGSVFNPATDGSLRFDSGNLSATAVHPTSSFVRVSGMSVSDDAIMEWWDAGSGLQLIQADMGNGNSFTTATDNFYLGDIRVGATGLPANTPALTTANDTFEVSQVLVYDGKLSFDDIHSINDYIQNVPEPGSMGLLSFGLLLFVVARRRTV